MQEDNFPHSDLLLHGIIAPHEDNIRLLQQALSGFQSFLWMLSTEA